MTLAGSAGIEADLQHAATADRGGEQVAKFSQIPHLVMSGAEPGRECGQVQALRGAEHPRVEVLMLRLTVLKGGEDRPTIVVQHDHRSEERRVGKGSRLARRRE